MMKKMNAGENTFLLSVLTSHTILHQTRLNTQTGTAGHVTAKDKEGHAETVATQRQREISI